MRVNENIYDIALHHIGSNESNVFLCIIGAMDGVSFDETRGYISVYGWNGIFVEPMPVQFERLKLVYSGTNSICENVAISDYNGTIKMMTIDQEAIDSGAIHSCFGGMSAVYPPRNGLGSEGDKPVVEKYGKIVEVPCITPEELFTKHNINNIDIISIDAEGHDQIILKNIDIKKYNPKVIRIEYINLSEDEQNQCIKLLEDNGYVYNIIGQNLDAVRSDYWEKINENKKASPVVKAVSTKQTSSDLFENVTMVTGIWDLGRDDLEVGWKRNFDHYVVKFEELLKSMGSVPLIVFIDPKHENIVWKHRSKQNTAVYHQTKEQFNSAFFPFFDQVQKIRKNPEWYNQVGWLKDSTQGSMEWYNPMVMSKMFMLHNAKCFNPFNTEYFFWIDGGITNTVHPGYFSHDKVISKLEQITRKFLFVCFPYETTSEIHGFKIGEMNRIAGEPVQRVARGGIFGGHIDYLSQANDFYYGLLRDSLNRGFMGTEESIFTLMTYLDPDTYHYETIDGNGLLSTFFEKLKNNTVKVQTNKEYERIKPSNNKILLYINAFNSPEQLLMVLESFEQNDRSFIDKTDKILLNNSTNESLFDAYDRICENYGFVEQIRKGNLGICRSRQLAAEHFADSGSKYMLFFEDDMLLDLSDTRCRFGFNKKVNNLFETIIKIMNNEEYDFLKLSFSEFYGHNGEQWTWHNVPSQNRVKYFPKTKKRPNTVFNNIKTCNGTPYADGEVYYSNWPQIIDQEGNKKLFLDTKWDNPFEQTWMSHIYTLTIEKKVRPGILLASPITHNRKHFYPAEDRREN